ncbi:MAG: hypothetical protein ACRDY7_16405 [Acidimicrobiia bacterium]
MNLEYLARAVDERVHSPAADRADARLYGVRLGGGADVIDLELLAEGHARRIPADVRPPAGLAAIAIASTAWMAPMAEDGSIRTRPSRHPERRRVSVTLLIGGEAADDVSVMRYGDGAPSVLTGCVGVVYERMQRCWARRSR